MLALSAMYLVVALAYIFYLPSYTALQTQPAMHSYSVQLRRETGNSGAGWQFHRIFKTVMAAKSSNKLSPVMLLTVLFLFVFGALHLFNLSQDEKIYTKFPGYFRRFTFLNFGMLKI